MVFLLSSDFGGLIWFFIPLVNIRESLRVGVLYIEGRVHEILNSSRTYGGLLILSELRISELQKTECFNRCLRRKPTLNLALLLLKLYQANIYIRLVLLSKMVDYSWTLFNYR